MAILERLSDLTIILQVVIKGRTCVLTSSFDFYPLYCTDAYRSTLPTPHPVWTSRDYTQPWPSGSWLESTMGNQGSRRWKGRGKEVWVLVPLAASLQLDCSRINLPSFWWPFQQFHLSNF